MDGFNVLAPGGYTTVQDRGRFGFQQMGIPVCGALDLFAFQVANLLVGNSPDAAVLEITVMGPVLEMKIEADIALTGADMGISINDMPVDQWCSLRVTPGDRVAVHQVKRGCRGYLAVSGGVDVPLVMGSRSTYTGGNLGGFLGRPLKSGDILPCSPAGLLHRQRALPKAQVPDYPTDVAVRAIPGPQEDYFDEGLTTLFSSPFMVTAKADRMGYRLQGREIPIRTGMPKSIVSEPSMPGGIQIPADGQPIVLLVEQTVGGYAKIATVISSDLGKVAQTTPGDTLRFESVTLEAAHAACREEADRLAAIRASFS